MAMEARMASARFPDRRITGSPVARSVATAAKGMGSWLKSVAGARAVSLPR